MALATVSKNRIILRHFQRSPNCIHSQYGATTQKLTKIIMRRSPAVHRGEAMRSLLRTPIKSFALRFYRSRPISHWPRWASDLLEINTPANLTRKDALSAAGGSDLNIILALPDRTRPVTGDVAECGGFKGSSLAAIALYLIHNPLPHPPFTLASFHRLHQNPRSPPP